MIARISRESSYEDRFRGYSVELIWHSSEEINPERDVADVKLKTPRGTEYRANFVALGFLDFVFEKNWETGECARGTYFTVPKMVLVKKIDEESVRKTIDDMIKNKEIENYFSQSP